MINKLNLAHTMFVGSLLTIGATGNSLVETARSGAETIDWLNLMVEGGVSGLAIVCLIYAVKYLKKKDQKVDELNDRLLAEKDKRIEDLKNQMINRK